MSDVFGGRVEAPWDEAQLVSLNDFQRAGVWHPFTCPATGDDLVATVDGWVCPECEYTQTWAMGFMADNRWRGVGWERGR